MTVQSNHRFAVGSFDFGLQLRGAVDDLRRRGLASDSFHYLALARVFASARLMAASEPSVNIVELSFPENCESFGCTTGPLHDCLLDRLDSGARSLREALNHWLVPRHAAQFQEIVERGKIQLWIRLTSAEDERSAYQSLLANSSNAVGVHDLAPRPPRRSARS